jgi:hypothetical protein
MSVIKTKAWKGWEEPNNLWTNFPSLSLYRKLLSAPNFR